MDKERIQQAARGKRSSDVERRLNRRMRTYVVLIVVIGVWYLWSDDDEAPLERSGRSLAPLDVPAALESAPTAVVDPARLTSVRDGTRTERALLESEPLLHLLRQAGRLVYGDMEKLGVERGDWERLVRDGADVRGRPFDVLGTVKWIEQEVADGYLQVWCEVEDEDGRPWAFVAVTEPYDLRPGQVVRVSGFYLKAYDLLRPDGTQVTTPLLIGDEILPSSFPIDPVTALDDDLLSDVRDRDLAQSSAPLDSPAFWHLLSYIDTVDEATFAAPGISEVMPTELLTRPGAWRGQPVSVTGVLYFVTETALGPRGENPLGIPFGWQLWMSDNRAGQAGTILLVTLDEPVGVEPGQIVSAEGLFFRRYSFENKRSQPHMATVVVARRVTPFVPEPDTLTPILMRVIVGVVGLVALLIVLGQWKERRQSAGARTRRMQRHRGNVARPGLLGGAGPGKQGAAAADQTEGMPEREGATGQPTPEAPPPAGPTGT